MVDISTKVCGVKLGNPTVLPAGILGVTAASLVRAAREGAGAVTTKSIGPGKRAGHKAPVVAEVNGSLINAVGLSCPGLDESVEELRKAVKGSKSPVIASFYGRSVEEFAKVAQSVSEARPHLIEANISCPNIEDEFGKPFATSEKLAAEVTAAVKDATGMPLIVKLSPNVADIKAIASAVESAGADAISAINTVGPGMLIDIDTGRPVLSNRAGGLSGPAIRPVAVRCVYDISSTVGIPVVGMGGVSCARDAIEMLMAGACAVGVGTAVWKNGPGVFTTITEGIARFMEERGFSRLEEIIGLAQSSK